MQPYLSGLVLTVTAAAVLGLIKTNRRLRGQLRNWQERDAEKDRVMALLAHELRSPLSGITNALYLMRMKGTEATERPQVIAERSLQQMSRLIDDLMDVSRITRGRVQLRYSSFDLRELLMSLVPAFEAAALAKGLEFKVDAHDALVVFGDPMRLSQVLSNLIGNALKFTDHGRVTVLLYRGDQNACFTVKDSGIGIPAAVLPHIWEPFKQGMVSDGRGGLGLGLSVVQGLVELHGGWVKAQSGGPGTGSCFTVELPLEEGLTGHSRHT